MAKKNKKKEEQLVYSGNVTLKLVKDNRVLKTIHTKNTATNRLLYGIALHLSKLNNHNINLYQPNFMAVGSNGTKNSDIPNLANLPDLLTAVGNKVDLERRSPIVDLVRNRVTSILVGVFTYSMISSAEIREIGLFSSEESASLLARVTVNPIQLSPGMSLIVEWNSGLENKVG